MKIFFRNIHLYLSLAAGVVILCSCLTGTVLVFEKEINQALHREHYFVEARGDRMPVAALIQKVKQAVPKAKISSVSIYHDAARTVEFSAMLPQKKEQTGKKTKDRPEKVKGEDVAGGKDKKPKEAKKPTTTIYVNPYTGELVGQFNKRESFLFTVEMLHRFLLAGKDSAGDMIVGIATLLFLFILITGVILWWPKTKNILRQRLKVKWDGSTKRLTHDLHVVFGFYTSVFLIVIVLSGLVMSFKWANNALYTITGSSQTGQPEPPESLYLAGRRPVSVDAALESITAPLRSAEYYQVRLPGDSSGVYTVNVQQSGSAENTADTYYIDQYSGKQIGSLMFAGKSLGQRLRALVKPVHTGSVYGLPTKILSFVICLLACIFPVTGVMMWLSRIKKSNKKIRKKRPGTGHPPMVIAT